MNKTFEKIADYFAIFSLSKLNKYDVLGVEKKVNFQIDEHPFIGFIDLLVKDKADGKFIIIDHKSSEYPLKKNGEIKKNCEKSFEGYKKQLYLYSYAVKKEYGEFPKQLVWNFFKSEGRSVIIPFEETELNKVIEWFKSEVKRVSTEEEYEPSENFFYCNNLCRFRNVCEYKKESDVL